MRSDPSPFSQDNIILTDIASTTRLEAMPFLYSGYGNKPILHPVQISQEFEVRADIGRSEAEGLEIISISVALSRNLPDFLNTREVLH